MKRFNVLLIGLFSLVVSYSATAQMLPNDLERNGLRGRVHFVEESDIRTYQQPDTIHIKRIDTVIVRDTHWILFIRGKINESLVEKETTIIKDTMKCVYDTHYYCRTEYSLDGDMLSRILVQPNKHETTITVYDKIRNLKVLEKTYCHETDTVSMKLFHYNNQGKILKPNGATVVKYKREDEHSAQITELIEFEYEGSNKETCLEIHISPNGKHLGTYKFESGMLTDEPIGDDRTVHYLYDEDGYMFEAEVYVSEIDKLYTEEHEHIGNKERIRRLYPDGRKEPMREFVYTKDEFGNWRKRCCLDGESRTRNIIYY